MEKNSYVNRLQHTNLHALLTGLVIAALHFLAVSLFSPLSDRFPVVNSTAFSVRDIIQFALIAPSIMLLTILARFASQLLLSDTFIYASSSFFYGVTGALLMIKRKIPRQIGGFLLAWLILSNCAMWLMLVILD